jgi:hypothetical protein
MSRFLLATLGVVSLTTLAVPTRAEDLPDIRSAVYVLVDISETWHRKENAPRNQDVLRAVNQGILALGKRIDRPGVFAYATIGDLAVTQGLVCNAIYRPTLIALKKDTTILKREEDLRTFLSACAKAALLRPGAPRTDISGALDFVSRQIGEKQTTVDRYAIVLSDMKEERGARGPTTLNLKGFKVLFAYRALPEDDRNPKELETRLQLWRKRLTEAGATVTAVIDTGLVAQAITQLASGNQ